MKIGHKVIEAGDEEKTRNGLWSRDTECVIFEFRGTQNDWIEIPQKINLIFLTLKTFEQFSAKAACSKYLQN